MRKKAGTKIHYPFFYIRGKYIITYQNVGEQRNLDWKNQFLTPKITKFTGNSPSYHGFVSKSSHSDDSAENSQQIALQLGSLQRWRLRGSCYTQPMCCFTGSPMYANDSRLLWSFFTVHKIVGNLSKPSLNQCRCSGLSRNHYASPPKHLTIFHKNSADEILKSF
jgi:hypothetical protein